MKPLLSHVDVDALLAWCERRPEPIPLRWISARRSPPDLVHACDGCGLFAPCWFGAQGALYCVSCRNRTEPVEGAA